ncbi:cupin domain-containing protein [Gracilinema caldarium]|uniref:cupin domain-containing protein n=1 Tax=Gracilinema caldarium TaxID=215591 RepID=UPI0026EFF6F1|nr:cupin domain-containing protein [Gracilinema caldarium]
MFFFNKDLKALRLDEKSERTIKARGGSLMASEMHFAPGGVGALHSHPHEQIVYVLEGEADFTLGDETRRIAQGDSIYVAPHVVHGVVALTEFRALDVFCPQREDFLR